MALRAGRLMLMAAAKAQQARASTEKLSTKVPKPKTNPSPTPSPIKKEKTGIMLDRPVSTEMGKFCGVSEISRTEAMKKIWVYIKEKDLQNPENKREIICDEKLKTIFDGKTTVGMMEIAKLISPHFIKAK
ncbi:protein TRI1 isoform X2 [Cryptomeria japonica]|uniref:protein TRI1 isoform X2 n=1 Tax=Cryptomeria japonica TaxID=3369 RepID=UPI0025ACCE47|nr:protein TRI1 isoform X2 [Cryptomeria japonica]